MIYIFFTIAIVMCVVIRLLLTKSDCNTVHKLDEQFEAWVLSTNQPRPSNDLFRQLYQRATGNTHAITPLVRDLGLMYQTTQTDVLDNFPTTSKELVAQELGILRNLVDYFDARWMENRSPVFWIRFFIFWPQKVVRYLGLKEDGIAARFANVLGWLIEALVLFYKPFIKSLF